jgi:lipoprotein-anchoring transpeptidase ErfK/SrfK
MTYFVVPVMLALVLQSTPQSTVAANAQGQQALAIQVALDRAGFSSGVIDGRAGANTRRAIEAYRTQHGREPVPAEQPLLEYRVTPLDAAGPFAEQIPSDLMEQSKLPALAYRSVIEALAERFHTTPEVLKRVNSSATFAADSVVLVPNVDPLVLPAQPAKPEAEGLRPEATGTSGRASGLQGSDPPKSEKPGEKTDKQEKPDVVVSVSRSAGTLTVSDIAGKIVFFAPVTTGSKNDPLPLGEWKVNGVQNNPTFKYNPDLFWDANPSHTKATIPAGPNGPVGLVWIDISKEHYGLHGSPEPSQIGRTESHGCVRMTNWDALRVAALVKPGTRVVFTE